MPKVSQKSIEQHNQHSLDNIFRKTLQIYYIIHIESFFLERRKMIISSCVLNAFHNSSPCSKIGCKPELTFFRTRISRGYSRYE